MKGYKPENISMNVKKGENAPLSHRTLMKIKHLAEEMWNLVFLPEEKAWMRVYLF